MEKMQENENRKEHKYIAIIGIIFTCAHWPLLVVTGRWWDDWAVYNQTTVDLWNMAKEMGRPSYFYITEFISHVPEPCYRIITFFMFLLSAMFLYRIIRYTFAISDEKNCALCCIYSVIPVNDIRIAECVFPYTIGVFFFMLAFYNLVILIKTGKTFSWRRVINWILFLCSFILNANLCLYLIVLLFVATEVTKKYNKRQLICFVDYLFLPIAFYVTSRLLFPTQGGYADYNSISIGKAYIALVNLLPADLHIIRNIIANCFMHDRIVVFIMLTVCVVFIVDKRKCVVSYLKYVLSGSTKKMGEWPGVRQHKEKRVLFSILVVGFLVLSLGLFAYVLVRGTYNINTIGVNGRDATLAAFGAAMIIFSIIELVFSDDIGKYITIGILIGGIAFFNLQYWDYQEDYYRQLGFQEQLKVNEELKSCSNVIFSCNENNISGNAFYALNGNSEEAYGCSSIAFWESIDSADSFIYDTKRMQYITSSNRYHLKDYDIFHKRIDAFVNYSMPMSICNCFKVKYLEFVDKHAFYEYLRNNSKMKVAYYGSPEYEKILK